MLEIIKKNLDKLVKSNYQKENEAFLNFFRMFDIEPSFFKRVFFREGKSKSDYLTKREIAQILFHNSLVNDIREGVKEAEKLVREPKPLIGTSRRGSYRCYFEELIEKGVSKKYRLVIYRG